MSVMKTLSDKTSHGNRPMHTSGRPASPVPDLADTQARIPVTKVPALSTDHYGVIGPEHRTILNSPSIQLSCNSDTAEVEDGIRLGYAAFLSGLTGNRDVAFAIRRSGFFDPRTSAPLHYVAYAFEEGRPERHQLREMRCSECHPEVEFALGLGLPMTLSDGAQNDREVGLATNAVNTAIESVELIVLFPVILAFSSPCQES